MKNLFYFFLLFFLLSFCSQESVKKAEPNTVTGTKTIKVQMQAKEIFLAGNFNAWKIKDPVFQFQTKDGLNWQLTLPVTSFKKGKNEYKLIVDGDWKVNPSDLTEDSSLSGKINVFDIK